eukprot:8623592-Alexandrium_andersonii.AAC.1
MTKAEAVAAAHRFRDTPVYCAAFHAGKCNKESCRFAHLDAYAVDAIKDAAKRGRERVRALSAESIRGRPTRKQ